MSSGSALFPAAESRLVAAGLAILLLATALPLAGAGGSTQPTFAAGNATEVIGGRTWSADIRVTQSAYNDTAPQVYLDANSSVHLLWRKLVGANDSYYYSRFDLAGNQAQNETYITNRTIPSAGPQYPVGPAIGLDSRGDIHVVYDIDNLTVGYQKLGPDGTVIVGEQAIGSADGIISDQPALSVAADDTVHVAHEDYKFSCEDIVYDKLANDGSAVWNNRVVSSDVATHAEFPLVKTSRYSGDVLFTYGSSTGTWFGRFNKFGVKDLPSVKIRTAADYKLADVAETPDGGMHMTWLDAGHVYYTFINSTGSMLVDDWQFTVSPTARGFPHLQAASDNSIVLTWEDSRSGTWQVMYAVFRASDNLSAIPQVQLTNSTVGAYQPWVALDPDDGIVVAWVDERDGNPEIYYKRTLSCEAELYGDPIELASLFFWHPNETRGVPLHLRNKGLLADSFVVDLQVAAGAFARGWNVTLNRTHVEDLPGRVSGDLLLTIHAPADGRTGESINVTLNASSLSSADCFDEVRLSATIRVTRSLRLNAVTSTARVADNGETVQFAMVATNTGDVREDGIEILVGGNLAPAGWTVTADQSSLGLGPNETAYFYVFVTVPNDTGYAPGNFNAIVGVTIRSNADRTVESSTPLYVYVKLQFALEINLAIRGARTLQQTAPGGEARFELTVTNVGNLAPQAQVYMMASGPLAPGWSATLSTDPVYLRGGENASVILTVWVPATATAGSRLDVLVSAFAMVYGASANISVSVAVPSLCGFNASYSTLQPADRYGRAIISVQAVNLANFAQAVDFELLDLPSGWTRAFSVGGAPISSFTLPAWQSTNFTVELVAASTARAGSYSLLIRFNQSECGVFVLPLTASVEPFVSFSVVAVTPSASAPAAGTATFDLRIQNDGNAPVALLLTTADLGGAYQARFIKLGADFATEFPRSLEGTLLVDAFSAVGVRLYLTLPNVTLSRGDIFTVRADDPRTAATSAAVLTLEIPWADAAVTDARLIDVPPRAGTKTVVIATVENAGEAPMPPSKVFFYLDGDLAALSELGSLGPGASQQVSFNWTPTPGDHELRFVVQLLGAASELDSTNNLFTLHESVAAPATMPYDVDMSAVITVAIFVAAGAALLLIFRAPPRRAPPPGRPPVRENP